MAKLENENNDARDEVNECDDNGIIECVNEENDDEENNGDVTGREKVNEHDSTDEEHRSGDEENEIDEQKKTEFMRLQMEKIERNNKAQKTLDNMQIMNTHLHQIR
ncbi:hypothetical protein DPMN_109140 [Dreissena polymorpha]|uniref:Uncharacterized protein n=1 Tax=Dreissena polymorpha TaxID=45954 RepID=A0A9D4K9R1_DREPO|nr:hypothetical protein DPMN_109140 [Dreissena polymorpha]